MAQSQEIDSDINNSVLSARAHVCVCVCVCVCAVSYTHLTLPTMAVV